jgi:tetratricopeptide (TPR) repeat protein
VLDLNLANGSKPAEAIEFLEQLELTKKSAVLMEKLGDLYTAQGKPSSGAHAYQEALSLDPTAEQRIRLRLTLGEKLVALEREPEAYEDYQKLVRESPTYPDKVTVLRKLVALARKLDKHSDIETYESAIKAETGMPRPTGAGSSP